MFRKLLVTSLSLCLLAVAGPAFAGKSKSKAYGKALSKDATSVTVTQLVDSPESYVDKRVRVKGIVTDVCTHRGCWILIGGEEGKTVRFKVEDGEIVFPVETKGQRCDAEGIFTKNVISVDDQIKRGKHYAEKEGTEFDPKSVTGPVTQYQLKGEGAVLR